MLASLLIGLVAGQRAMTPLAVLAGAAQRGALPTEVPGVRLLSVPLVSAGAVALAAAEMAGDKMASAPDRTVPAGLLARTLTAAFAGAVLAEPGRRTEGAGLAVAAAIGASFVGLSLRKRAMRRFGQTPTGFVEDAAVLALAQGIVSRRT
ncbi:hypothetical protein [Aureimonas sp. Leaf324]|jgi:uncharacterized membrane protein|uniref:hypothetical protein n=1 Tax=Aureimonas sp. Leaf324 TaxID=1736336 RepID=UPI0007017192|nr:hypothetical protein [Aureimonas sp. Leaf324]KQQ86490.1 hypothetical protein ASF65_19805 [Aureimonas sp. Leaf324]